MLIEEATIRRSISAGRCESASSNTAVPRLLRLV